LPPVLPQPRTILDLGSNIGLTVAHFAWLYKEARILGIEMDRGNFKMCKLNTAPHSDHCEVLWGAAWTHDGEVSYSGNEEWGFRVSRTGVSSTPSYSMASLISRLGSSVDYVKMDIEGAERDILSTADSWIRSARCLKIEIHEPYTVEMCIKDLEKWDFRCERDRAHWACVVATRAE
jgi:FkbM family methyltransferase